MNQAIKSRFIGAKAAALSAVLSAIVLTSLPEVAQAAESDIHNLFYPVTAQGISQSTAYAALKIKASQVCKLTSGRFIDLHQRRASKKGIIWTAKADAHCNKGGFVQH